MIGKNVGICNGTCALTSSLCVTVVTLASYVHSIGFMEESVIELTYDTEKSFPSSRSLLSKYIGPNC